MSRPFNEKRPGPMPIFKIDDKMTRINSVNQSVFEPQVEATMKTKNAI